MYLAWCKRQASNVTSGCGIFQCKYIVMYLLLKAFKTLKTTKECIGSDGTYFLLTVKTFYQSVAS